MYNYIPIPKPATQIANLQCIQSHIFLVFWYASIPSPLHLPSLPLSLLLQLYLPKTQTCKCIRTVPTTLILPTGKIYTFPGHRSFPGHRPTTRCRICAGTILHWQYSCGELLYLKRVIASWCRYWGADTPLQI